MFSASFVGQQQHPAGSDPIDGHVLPDPDLSRRGAHFLSFCSLRHTLAHDCVRCEEVEMCALTLGADGGSVEEGWLSGDARVRELQTPPSGPGGRRSGAAPHALPDAALHRHRTRRQPGDLSHLSLMIRPQQKFDALLTFVFPPNGDVRGAEWRSDSLTAVLPTNDLLLSHVTKTSMNINEY